MSLGNSEAVAVYAGREIHPPEVHGVVFDKTCTLTGGLMPRSDVVADEDEAVFLYPDGFGVSGQPTSEAGSQLLHSIWRCPLIETRRAKGRDRLPASSPSQADSSRWSGSSRSSRAA